MPVTRSNVISKRNIQQLLSVIVSLVVSADVSASSWGGYYVGGEYGKAASRVDWSYTNANYFNTAGANVLGSNFNINANSNLGGIYLGYNYEFAAFVLGLEGSFMKSNLNTTKASPYFPVTDTETTEIRRIGALKARAGYIYQNWLVSFYAGWSAANVNLSIQDSVANISASSSGWSRGWIVGPTFDYRITEGFSLGLAYDHIRIKMPNKSLACAACGTGVGFGAPAVNGTLNINSVTTRLTYYFG